MEIKFDIEKALRIGAELAKTLNEISLQKEEIRSNKHNRRVELRKLKQEYKLKMRELRGKRNK